MDQSIPSPTPTHHALAAVRAALAERVARWTQGTELLDTRIPELTLYRKDAPALPSRCIVEPSIALVVQGSKSMLLGDENYAFGSSNFLLTSLDLPATVQIVDASRNTPYLGLAFRLDPRVLSELVIECALAPQDPQAGRGMVLGEMTLALLDAFRRLLELLDEPESIAVMAPLIKREIYYRILVSDQGARLRQISSIGSQSHRIARTIEWLKANFAQPLRVEELAARAKMSASAFHQHFRTLTTMSPLQFQKWLRLNEARQLMLTEHFDASSAAFRVGYESPTQFSREYRRLFGAPPLRDIEELRRQSGILAAAPAPRPRAGA